MSGTVPGLTLGLFADLSLTSRTRLEKALAGSLGKDKLLATQTQVRETGLTL